jgi:isopentenyl-diphosphate delta-isomerase
MTGGTPRGLGDYPAFGGRRSEHGLPMGVGSQRAAVEDPGRARYFRVRDVAPDIFLLGNLGAVQLNLGYGVDECRRVVEMIEANALVLHLNPLQEALQAEGDTGSAACSRASNTSVAGWRCRVVKEIGGGISGEVPAPAEAGVAAMTWAVLAARPGVPSNITGDRSRAAPGKCHVCRLGDSTATSLQMVLAAVPNLPVIASGGLRNGLDAAKPWRMEPPGGICWTTAAGADAGEDMLDTVVTATIEEVGWPCSALVLAR